MALDPQDGRELWRRSDLPVDVEICGQKQALVVMSAGSETGIVLCPTDGRTLRSVGRPGDRLPPVLTSETRWLIVRDGLPDGNMLATMFDVAEVRKSWQTTFPATTQFFPVDDVWFGALEETGDLHFLSWATGESAASSRLSLPPVDEQGHREIHTLTDTKRILVFASTGVSDQRRGAHKPDPRGVSAVSGQWGGLRL